jgi:molybdate transport system ATP-binding protein
LHVQIRKRLESDKSRSFTLDVAFDATEGITILFGQSGSGKTTTLRAIAGIVTPDSGRISIGEEVYFDSARGVNLSIQKRRVGFVFQDYALFPHMTAEQNVAFGIKGKGARGASKLERAREMLTVLKIEQVRQRYPQNMSGGEQQRTALARALASDPAVVLLDEPLSAVDAETRARLIDELVMAQQRVKIPFIYVTHNVAEAIRLGTQVVVLHEGSLKRMGPTAEVFNPSDHQS